MRVTWLADVLHAAHLQLVPLDGWQGRGRELTTINGVVLHHTATPTSSPDANVAKILRDGRADLPGPLSQLGLDRQGRFWLIADGKSNHNGHGMWGNQAIGIEAFNDGKGEAWPAVQIDAWQRATAAILAHLNLNEGHALGHRETDPDRKIDPRGVNLEAFRRRVAQLLRPTVEDDPLMPVAKDDQDARRAWVREQCLTYWGREPSSADHDYLANEVAIKGADVVLATIADHSYAQAFRARRGW